MAIEEGNINEEISDEEFQDLYKKLLKVISDSDLSPIDKLNIKTLLRNSDLKKRFESALKVSYKQMADDADKMVPRSEPREDTFTPEDNPRSSKEFVYVKEGKAYISKDDLLQIVKEELLTTLSFDKD